MPAAAHAQHSKLSLESIGPAGGNGTGAADVVGTQDSDKRIFMTTTEHLTSGDTDSSLDLYSKTGGVTTLLSTGTSGGNGAFAANFGRARQSGTRVFFQTDEKLVTTDTDSSQDVYMRESGTTTLVSTGPGAGANGAFDAYFGAASTDGSRVFFFTRGALVGGDTDSTFDIYERSSGNTSLVSTGSAGGNGPHGAELGGISDDGTKVFFTTAESLVASDTDSVQDVYQRAGGVTTLASVGPNGGNGTPMATYDGNSQDGSKVFFRTAESLVAADTDGGIDVYERANGSTTTIHSIGPGGGNSGAGAAYVGASRDGSRVFIETQERLIAAPVDRDSQNDVYMSTGGTMTMVSPGGNDVVATNAYFVGASDNGTRAFIRSEESLVAADTDMRVYAVKLSQAFRDTGVNLRAGGLGGAPNRALYDYKKFDLDRLASETGGRAYEPGSLDKKSVTGILRSIATEIKTEYIVGYQPDGAATGRKRKVKVELVDRSLGSVRGGERTLVR